MPASYIDNLYCLATGDAGVMNFGFRNESGAKIEHPVLVVQLPKFVDVLDFDASATILSRKPVAVESASLLEYRFDLAAWRNRIHDGDFPYPYNQWDGLMLLLRTTQPASDALHKAWYWIEDGSYRSKPLRYLLTGCILATDESTPAGTIGACILKPDSDCVTEFAVRRS